MREWLLEGTVEVGQVYRHRKEGYFVLVTASSRFGETEFRRLRAADEKPALLKIRHKKTHYFEYDVMRVTEEEALLALRIDYALSLGYGWYVYLAAVRSSYGIPFHYAGSEWVAVLISPEDQLRPEKVGDADPYTLHDHGPLNDLRLFWQSAHASALPELPNPEPREA